MCTCKYCNREFDSYLALGGHISHCANNPNRRKSEDYKKFQSAGITASLERLNKEKENDPYRYKVKEFILTDCGMCSEYEGFHMITGGIDISKVSYLLKQIKNEKECKIENIANEIFRQIDLKTLYRIQFVDNHQS